MDSSLLVGSVNIVFHGLAYAMVLYLISVGLAVTMGFMGFINLAHGVFAVLGGYVTQLLIETHGLNFWPSLGLAVVVVTLFGAVIERIFYARLYRASEIDQVLLTLGIIFAAVASTQFLFGPNPQQIKLPPLLQGSIVVDQWVFPVYRVFLIAVGGVLVLAIWLGLERTSFGAKVRATVDNRRMAEVVGIQTGRIFTLTFMLGTALAVLGGALGSNILALSPTYPIEHLPYILIVVAVGGLGSIRGAFYAALLLGITDSALRYALPQSGGFIIFLLASLLLMARPAGLVGTRT